jgi:hypothetical protein
VVRTDVENPTVDPVKRVFDVDEPGVTVTFPVKTLKLIKAA